MAIARQEPAPVSAGRLAYIDTLRGFAACWVFVLHIYAYWLANIRLTGISFTRIVTFGVGIGGLGVDLFIVLSGFCLCYPVVRSTMALQTQFDVREFYRRRAYRLLPAYYVALALTSLLILIPALQSRLAPQPLSIPNFASYFFLVQTFSNNTVGTINGSWWSIALEAQLYVLFPLLILLYRKCGLGKLIASALVAAIIWPSFCQYFADRTGIRFSPELHAPARLIEFVLGMAAAEVVADQRCESMHSPALVFTFTLPVVVILHTGLVFHGRLPSIIPDMLAGISFASLIVLLANYPERHFSGKHPVGMLTRVGVISYSFYLLHQPIILLTAPLAQFVGSKVLPTFVLSSVTALPATVGLAYVFFLYVERPFFRRRRSTTPAVLNDAITAQALP